MQKITGSRHLFIAVAVYIALACVSFKEFLLSRLDRIAGNFGDNRLCIVLVEHWFRVFRGLEPWNDPRFFYPARGVLGYTETMFLGSLPYALFRFLACDPYVSFELTLILATLCGYVGMIYLLRRWLNAGETLSITGAALFSLSNVSHLWILCAKTYSVMLLPCLLILLLQLVDDSPKAAHRRRGSAFAFCALLSLLYFSTFYTAYFFTLLLVLALAIYLLLTRSTPRRLVMPRPTVLVSGAGGLALGFIPFFITYGPVIKADHGWDFSQFLVNAMQMQNVLDPGGGNLVWGRWLHLSGASPMAYGVPPILALIFVGTIVWLVWLRASGRMSRLHSALLASGLATILLLAATIKYDERLFWYYLWCWLPGARTVRVLPRLFIVAGFFITIVSIGGLCQLKRRVGSGLSQSRVRWAVWGLVAASLVLEQVNLASVHGISRDNEQSRLGKIPSAPSSCRSLFLMASRSTAHPIALQIDAMLLGQRNNLPTVNGWGALQPESWHLNVPQSPDYFRNLDEWLDSHGIAEGSCGVDIENSSWLMNDAGNRLGRIPEFSAVRPAELRGPTTTETTCALDDVNGQNRIVASAERDHVLDLKGWAFDSSTGVVPDVVFVELSVPEQSSYFGRAVRFQRPDVAQAFGNKAYQISGYATSSSIGAVPAGLYSVRVWQSRDGSAFRCDTGRTIVVQ